MNVFDRYLVAIDRISAFIKYLEPLFALGVRLWVGMVFVQSGWLKLTSFENTLWLFTEEYRVPILPPAVAAVAGTGGELAFGVLVMLGLAGRLSALGLSAVNAMAVVAYAHVLFGQGFVAKYAKTISAMIGFEYTRESVKDQLSTIAGAVTAFLYAQIQTVLSNVFSVVFHFVIMIVMLFYLFIDGPKLKSYLFMLSPLPPDEEELIATQFKNVGRATLFGNGIGSLIQGTIAGLAMAVVGLPSPVMWGSVASIFAIARPIQQLSRAMQELAEGNFGVQLPGIGRKDEIGAVAQAVENFLPQFQQQLQHFVGRPFLLALLRLGDISVQNRFD